MDDKPLDIPPAYAVPRPLKSHDPLHDDKVKANIDHESKHRLELLKSVVAAGESSLKMLLLINGGAAVALLAFLGNVLTKDKLPAGVTAAVPKFTTGLLRYATGVAIVGVAAVLRFLALWYARRGQQAS